MKFAVCDDEREIRNIMQKNIRTLYPDADILLFKDGRTLLSYPGEIDILLLDIQMGRPNGIEVAAKMRRKGSSAVIIFITAIEEYVFQAFDVKAFHYLVKPIDPVKFFGVLRRAVEERKKNRVIDLAEKEGLVIKKGCVTRKIYLCEILYLEVFNRTVVVHTAQEDIAFYGKLSAIEKDLSSDFVRCHRSFIVNLRYVAKYDASVITLTTGERFRWQSPNTRCLSKNIWNGSGRRGMTVEMLDRLYEIVVRVDWNAERLVAAVCLAVLCGEGMEPVRAGLRKRAHWITGAIYFLIYMGLYWIPGWSGYFVNILALFAALVFQVWTEPGRLRTNLYLFSTFLTVCWMAQAIANSIGYFLTFQIDKGIYRLAGPGDPALQTYGFFTFIGYILIALAVNGGILLSVVHVVKRMYAGGKWELQTQEFLILMIPVLNGAGAHSILWFYNRAYEEKTGFDIYEAYPGVDYLWMLYYLILLASIVSTSYLYQIIRRKREAETTRSLLESQIKDIRLHITEVEKLYTDIRGVKHDLRNHTEIINGLLASGKAEEAGKYFGSLAKAVETFEFPVKTGNPVTDVLLHEKMRSAQEKGIGFVTDFGFPADMGIDAFDVSVILSNALSNAIEATKPGGTIRLTSIRKKNAYLMIVENPFEDLLETGPDGALPKSSKPDKEAHGLGLKNIRAVAEKYYGTARIEQKEKTVTLTVMLQAVEEKEAT